MKRLLFIGFLLVSYLGQGQVMDTAAVRKEVDSLVQVCRGLTGEGKYEEALGVIEVAKNKAGEVFGVESAGYSICLHNQGRVFHLSGKYVEALPFYLEAKTIREKVFGKEHPDYANSLNNLANVYQALVEYDKAEQLHLEAKTIREKVLGNEHPDYAQSLNNLSALYAAKGEYTKAESLLLAAIKIWAKVLGKGDPEYAGYLGNLASLYLQKGEYYKAEILYLEGKEILTKAMATEHPSYKFFLFNLSLVYRLKGDYTKAEELILEEIQIEEKTVGNGHPDYAYSINGLAIIYDIKGEYKKAEALYLETINIWAKTLGREHPYYAGYLNNLASLYLKEGEYSKSESLFLEAIEILTKTLGKEHPDYAQYISNLANLYTIKGDFTKAEPLFLEAMTIQANTLGNNHQDFARTINNLSTLYQAKHEISLATYYFIKSNNLHLNLIQKTSAYSSENEMLAYLQQYKEVFDQFYSFAQTYPNPKFIHATYDNALFLNGLLLENVYHIAISVASADNLTRDVYERWQGCQRRLAKEYAKPISERRYVAEQEAEAEGFEKTLIRNLPIFSETRYVSHWQDLRDRLRPGETAIEFIHYRYYTPSLTDSTIYAALLLLPSDTAPHFIPLCEERQLDTIINKPNGSRANYLQNLYSAPRADGLASLYHLIWAPIEKVLKEKDVKTVYYAPSGLLHRLNLAAITPDKSGQTLGDQYHLIPVASTRQLVTDHSEASLPNSAIIYGGVRYEMDSTAIARANKDLSATAQDTTGGLFRYAVRGGERADNWDTLPGTKREARYLYDLLTKRGVNATLRLGYDATEESMKQIGQQGPSPSLLHIGTHGFFFPDPKDTTRRRTNLGDEAPVFKISEHPLIRSGLKLAGSKYAWENKRPMHGMEDGILTAYEVSQMNLSNTQLVVLSACETGLGDIKGNEGVYGLQRAFRIAGAKNVLMSLWKVPDEATEKLMTRFYANWLEQKMPLREAFENAQKWLRGQKGYENPYYWAGFVLIGEL